MINLILSETSRSLIYLDKIIKNRIKISKIILYSEKFGEVYKLIKKNKLENLLIYCKSKEMQAQ